MPLMIPLEFLLIAFGFEIVIGILVLWKDMLAFFFPSDWAFITIKRKSLDTVSFVQSRGATDTFTWKNNAYFMFFPPIEVKEVGKEETKKKLNPKAHLRHGRLVYLWYEEGEPYPKDMINFETVTTYDNIEKLQKKEFDDMWKDEFNLAQVIMQNIIPILCVLGLIVVVIVVIVTGGKAPPPPTGG